MMRDETHLAKPYIMHAFRPAEIVSFLSEAGSLLTEWTSLLLFTVKVGLSLRIG